MKKMKKYILAFAVFVVALLIAITPVVVSAAGLWGVEYSDMGDLLVIEDLFDDGSDVLGDNELGNIFLLDELFNQSAEIVPTRATAPAPVPCPVSISERLSGHILIQVESNGEAWYVYPDSNERYYLGNSNQAFSEMADLALGVTNANFDSIQANVPSNMTGKFVIKVEDQGKMYYVAPDDNSVVFVGNSSDATSLINSVGLGVSNSDLNQIDVAAGSLPVN